MVNNYKSAVTRLWNGVCDVFILKSAKDKTTGRTKQDEVKIIEKEPCLVSYKTISAVNTADEAAKIPQTVKLFISKNIDVPAGSKIVVTQQGRTESYQRSGKPAVYSTHQEIMLELFRRWA